MKGIHKFASVVLMAVSFVIPQVAGAQDPTEVLDQPTLIESPTLPVEVFTNGHSIDFDTVATMCDPDCGDREIGAYVDFDGVLHLDGVIIVPGDRLLGFTIEPGYSAMLYTWEQVTVVGVSDTIQTFPAAYNRAVIFNGPMPQTVRSTFQSSLYNMSDLCQDGECSAYQAFSGVGVANSYDQNNPEARRSPECANYILPEGVVVQFDSKDGDALWSSGPLFLPGQCGRVWVYWTN